MSSKKIHAKFRAEEDCIRYLEEVRWEGVPTCPYCYSQRSTPISSENRHHCNTCNTTYSVTVDTVFHNTRLSLKKWFLAINIILNTRMGISARDLGNELGVNKNTAWLIGKRVRKAMIDTDQRQMMMEIVKIYNDGSSWTVTN